MGISEITIRPFRPDEWQDYKAKRLDALLNEPDKFSGRHDRESTMPDAWWQDALQKNDRAIFGLHDGQSLIGLTGVFTETGPDGDFAGLHMSYLDASQRGRGLSNLFYSSRLAWARSAGLAEAYVSHRAGNEASRRAILKHGFELFRIDDKLWPDGKTAQDMIYRLKL